MVLISYKLMKKDLKIFSSEKVLSSKFRKWFLNQLSESFDLYERLNGEIRLLNYETIEESLLLTESDIVNFKKCYEIEKIDDINFEEFLDLSKVTFANIYAFNKCAILDQVNFEKDKNLKAIINLQPDGDVNSLCVKIFADDVNLFINLITRYNMLSCG